MVGLSVCLPVCLTVCVCQSVRLQNQSKQLKLHIDVVYMKRYLRTSYDWSECDCLSPWFVFLQDKTCIVWDLSKLTYVRQLSQHMAPITAICINDLTVSYNCSQFFNSLTWHSSFLRSRWLDCHATLLSIMWRSKICSKHGLIYRSIRNMKELPSAIIFMFLWKIRKTLKVFSVPKV